MERDLKLKLIIGLAVLVVVNIVLDLFGIYFPLRNEFSLHFLGIFMGFIFLASVGGLVLFWRMD